MINYNYLKGYKVFEDINFPKDKYMFTPQGIVMATNVYDFHYIYYHPKGVDKGWDAWMDMRITQAKERVQKFIDSYPGPEATQRV